MGSDIFFRLFDSLVKRLFFGAQLLQVMRDFRFLFFKHVSFFPLLTELCLFLPLKLGIPSRHHRAPTMLVALYHYTFS